MSFTRLRSFAKKNPSVGCTPGSSCTQPVSPAAFNAAGNSSAMLTVSMENVRQIHRTISSFSAGFIVQVLYIIVPSAFRYCTTLLTISFCSVTISDRDCSLTRYLMSCFRPITPSPEQGTSTISTSALPRSASSIIRASCSLTDRLSARIRSLFSSILSVLYSVRSQAITCPVPASFAAA